VAEGQPTNGLRSVLSAPALYSLTQRLVGARRSRRLLVARHIRPTVGERVLDIGCGPGELLDALPPVDYLGFDLNPRSVDAARRRRGDRGRFECVDVREADLSSEAPFDLVLAVGLLHHIDDDGVHQLLDRAASALADGGRLVTFDGVFVPAQPRLAGWLLERDRGQHVRTVDGYMRPASDHFATVTPAVSLDFLCVPYTHLVIEASGTQAS
jgi:SAM-dependent methyltransferase